MKSGTEATELFSKIASELHYNILHPLDKRSHLFYLAKKLGITLLEFYRPSERLRGRTGGKN